MSRTGGIVRIIVCLRAVFTRIRSQRRQRQSLSRCATAPLHKGAKEHFIYLAFSFPNWHFLHTGDPSDGLAAASVSLRLGHGAALTCHRHVIHYRAAASLPKRGAKSPANPPARFPRLYGQDKTAGVVIIVKNDLFNLANSPNFFHSAPQLLTFRFRIVIFIFR